MRYRGEKRPPLTREDINAAVRRAEDRLTPSPSAEPNQFSPTDEAPRTFPTGTEVKRILLGGTWRPEFPDYADFKKVDSRQEILVNRAIFVKPDNVPDREVGILIEEARDKNGVRIGRVKYARPNNAAVFSFAKEIEPGIWVEDAPEVSIPKDHKGPIGDIPGVMEAIEHGKSR